MIQQKIDPIVKLYLKKVISREMTVDEIPERWRAQVQEILNDEPPLIR